MASKQTNRHVDEGYFRDTGYDSPDDFRKTSQENYLSLMNIDENIFNLPVCVK